MKWKRPGGERDRRNRHKRKKRAPSGPAKQTAKKLPERPAMIAAARKRNGSVFARLSKAPVKWTGRLDRAANRGLERAHPPLSRAGRWSRAKAKRAVAVAGPRLRPVASWLFRALSLGDRALRRGCAATMRAATRASAVVTPQRAIAFVIVAAGACLVASQFVDYRAVEIGQPGYVNLPGVAKPPTVEIRTAGQAHSYVLVAIGVLAVALGALAGRRDRRRLGFPVAMLGLVSIAVILLVDLPHGLDAGAQTSRFSGATAVLEDGFYAELAAAAGLVLAGLLYYARPCRIRINLSGRAASARRRRPRRQDSSRATVARRA
jgi:hypothetical protein